MFIFTKRVLENDAGLKVIETCPIEGEDPHPDQPYSIMVQVVIAQDPNSGQQIAGQRLVKLEAETALDAFTEAKAKIPQIEEKIRQEGREEIAKQQRKIVVPGQNDLPPGMRMERGG